jgi:hypothetical protein
MFQVVLGKLRLRWPGRNCTVRQGCNDEEIVSDRKSHCSRKSKDAPHRVTFPPALQQFAGLHQKYGRAQARRQGSSSWFKHVAL